ncbi:MAG: DUF2269 domain-containing protein [Pseudomonadota bacterium]
MDYTMLKTLHILSAIFLFGTGFGSAFYKFFTDRSGSLAAIASTNRLVVWADWLFTTPTVILQPLTGYALVYLAGWSPTTPWLLGALGLYLLAGFCWLPVVFLQIRMRDLSIVAAETTTPLPATYHRLARLWFWLGIPAFAAMTLAVVLMVFKPSF